VSRPLRGDVAEAWPVTLSDGTHFEAPAGVDLITAAREAGWRMASSCRNGTCRTCRCVLVAGRIEHRIEWPGLSRDELAEGWILPCVAQARSALRLQTGATALDE
jgi:ferredoxin